MKNDPLKKVENYHGWKNICLTVGRSGFCLLWWFLFFSPVPVPIHMLISSFIIHYMLQHLTAGDGQMHPDTTVVESFSIFTSVGWIMRLRCKSWTEAEERNPSLLPSARFPCRKLHQRHNYLHCCKTIWNTISPSDSVRAATCTVHRRAKCRKCVSCRFPSRGRDGNNW